MTAGADRTSRGPCPGNRTPGPVVQLAQESGGNARLASRHPETQSSRLPGFSQVLARPLVQSAPLGRDPRGVSQGVQES